MVTQHREQIEAGNGEGRSVSLGVNPGVALSPLLWELMLQVVTPGHEP